MSEANTLVYAKQVQDQRDCLAKALFLMLLASKTPEQARSDIAAVSTIPIEEVRRLCGGDLHYV